MCNSQQPTANSQRLKRCGSVVTRIAGFRPFQFVGDISYSLYLWHWVALTAGALGILELFHPRLLGHKAQIVVSVVVAVLSFVAVEKSFRKISRILTYVAGALGIMVMCVSGGLLNSSTHFAMSNHDGEVHSRVMKALESFESGDKSDLKALCVGAIAEYEGEVCAGNVVQESAQAENRELWASGSLEQKQCYQPDFSGYASCDVGDLNGEVKVLAWGDSHIGHLTPVLDYYGQKHQVHFLVRTFPGVEPFWSEKGDGKDWMKGSEFMRLVVEQDLPQVSTVIVTEHQMVKPDSGIPEILLKLKLRGIRGVVVNDTPGVWQFDPAKDPTGSKAYSYYQIILGDRRELKEKINATGNAEWIDFDSALCKGELCLGTVGGLNVYNDFDHLNANFALTLYPYIAEVLDRVLFEVRQ